MGQLAGILEGYQLYQASSFFEQQLTAFEVGLSIS